MIGRALGSIDFLVASGKPANLLLVATVVIWVGGARGLVSPNPLVVPLLFVFPALGFLAQVYAHYLRNSESRGGHTLTFWRANFWLALGLILITYLVIWRLFTQALSNPI